MTYSHKFAFGHVMTVAQFRETVEDGGFIDYDGFCHPAVVVNGKIMQDGNFSIYPSDIDKMPDDATHVVWFNR